MDCLCGCGQDAGVYPRTRGKKRKGDPRPYLRGHWGHRRRRDDLPSPNPSGLCLCGCGRTTPIARQTNLRTGTVIGQHIRYWSTHGGRATWRVQITPDLWVEENRGFRTPCWIWQGGSSNQTGHGKLTMQRKVVGAHRAMYEQEIGPIPDGLQLDHLCKQPSCINPDHLEPVTPAENTRRSRAAKLTHEAVAYIRASDLSHAQLAEMFGVRREAIGLAQRGQTWA